MKLMWSIGRNVQSCSSSHDRFLTAESIFHFTFEHDEGFLEIVPMGWRSASWWDMHIDHAETSVRRLAAHSNRVGVANQSNVWEGFRAVPA